MPVHLQYAKGMTAGWVVEWTPIEPTGGGVSYWQGPLAWYPNLWGRFGVRTAVFTTRKAADFQRRIYLGSRPGFEARRLAEVLEEAS